MSLGIIRQLEPKLTFQFEYAGIIISLVNSVGRTSVLIGVPTEAVLLVCHITNETACCVP